MTAPARRVLVRSLTERGLSERLALTVTGMRASALRYIPVADRNVALAHRHRRYGAGMMRAHQPEPRREAGNPGQLALGDLAGDLRSHRPLSHRRLLRHAGTHRFVVIHDMLVGSRSSPYVEHHGADASEAATIDTLHLSPAAPFYLRDTVLWRERRLHADAYGKARGQMIVPLHHRIRHGR